MKTYLHLVSNLLQENLLYIAYNNFEQLNTLTYKFI